MIKWTANKIYELTLYKHRGFLAVNKANAGIFGYTDEGEYMGSKYKKARLYEIYKPQKSPQLRFARRRLGSYDMTRKTTFSNVGIQPELIPLAIEILDKIHQEITGETAMPKQMVAGKPTTGKRAERKPTAQELARRIGI